MRRALRESWVLIKPFWFESEQRWSSWFLFFLVMAGGAGSTYIAVIFNSWSRDFYNIFQEFKVGALPHLMLRFVAIIAADLLVWGYQFYFRQLLDIRWRAWMTERFLGLWFSSKAYYLSELLESGKDNPDQRISQDIESFGMETMWLVTGCFENILKMGSFGVILWGLSGTLDFTLAGKEFHIHGYLVWAAVAYAAFDTLITHLLGRKLVGLNFEQQKLEANFRFSLVRVRENAENIALSRGEPAEHRSLSTRISAIVGNFLTIANIRKRMMMFSLVIGSSANIVAILCAAPRYFAKKIAFGEMMQVPNAFYNVKNSLSFFASYYESIAGWRATTTRLTGFLESIHLAQERGKNWPVSIGPTHADGTALELSEIRVSMPNGEVLIEKIPLKVDSGGHLLIRGRSGSGKSTLLRTIAGIWPFAQGRVRQPEQERTMFLPQRAYLPIDSLHAAVTYPAPATAASRGPVLELLELSGLGNLKARIDDVENWALILSGGEQQKIAFARALFHQPKWLYLDEATSALDEESEKKLYRLVLERIPGVTLISVAHRASVRDFHPQVLDLGGST